jgi:hypothetical protein
MLVEMGMIVLVLILVLLTALFVPIRSRDLSDYNSDVQMAKLLIVWLFQAYKFAIDMIMCDTGKA